MGARACWAPFSSLTRLWVPKSFFKDLLRKLETERTFSVLKPVFAKSSSTYLGW